MSPWKPNSSLSNLSPSVSTAQHSSTLLQCHPSSQQPLPKGSTPSLRRLQSSQTCTLTFSPFVQSLTSWTVSSSHPTLIVLSSTSRFVCHQTLWSLATGCCHPTPPVLVLHPSALQIPPLFPLVPTTSTFQGTEKAVGVLRNALVKVLCRR